MYSTFGLPHTLCNSSQFAFFLWTELQHCVNDRQKCLPLTARLQENELQQDVLQIFQIGHTLLPLLVSLQATHFTLQQLAGRIYCQCYIEKKENIWFSILPALSIVDFPICIN